MYVQQALGENLLPPWELTFRLAEDTAGLLRRIDPDYLRHLEVVRKQKIAYQPKVCALLCI